VKASFTTVIEKSARTDLRIGQIGHGLGPRALGALRNDLFYDDLILTKNLQNCAEANRENLL